MTLSDVLTMVLTGIVTGVTGALVAAVRTNLGMFRYLKSSQKALIKDRIVTAHETCTAKGSISKYSLSVLEELYREYLLLGGNGFVTGLMKEIRALPID